MELNETPGMDIVRDGRDAFADPRLSLAAILTSNMCSTGAPRSFPTQTGECGAASASLGFEAPASSAAVVRGSR